MEKIQITPQITALCTTMPIPGLGFLPVNAFVIAGPTPILVDSGVTIAPGEFTAAVADIVDPADIRWIWLTHADRDHTGALQQMLAAAPIARVVTNFISVGHLMTGPEPLPMDRVYLVNSGDRVDVGDRQLVAIRPPLFDNPGTLGFFDPASRVLISSDCFGGVMPSAEASVLPDVAAMSTDELAAGQLVWGSADSPWVHSIDETKFAASLDRLRELDPELVLSTHLPAIHGNFEGHIDTLLRLPGTTPWVGPDQAALEAMLAELEPAQA